MIRGSAPRRLLAGAVVVGSLVAGINGCGTSAPALDEAASLEYRYGDASVPPEFHRSYTLALVVGGAGEPATGSLVVDSYGDVLHGVDVSVDNATWSDVVDQLDGLDRGDIGSDEGCTGGTSRRLEVRSADDQVLLDRSISVCGGSGGEEADELDERIAPLLADLDLASLLE